MPPYQGTMGSVRNAVIDRLKMDKLQDETRVLEWINLAYAQVVQETGCLQACGVSALLADEDSYQLPPEVEQIKSIHFNYQNGETSAPLQLLSLDEILGLRRQHVAIGERVGRPAYAMVGQNRFELWPDPGAGATVKFWYVYLPPALVNPSDTFLIREPYGSKLLELGACVEGGKFKKDPLIQSYQQEYGEWLRRFQGWLNRRQTGRGGTMRLITGTERPTLTLVSEAEAR